MLINVFKCIVISAIWIETVVSTSILRKDETEGVEKVVRVGTCANVGTLVEIRFNISDPLITLCHDESTDFTYWSKETIYGKNWGSEEALGKRPVFKEADYFKEIDAEQCYKTATQKDTIKKLLGSLELAEKYIRGEPEKLYLSRGHLVPSGDPSKSEEKKATYYFINASPQWQTVNGGNWERLERQLRDLAKKTLTDLAIWTGSYGHLMLNNVNNVGVEIWLGRDSSGNPIKKLPVNLFTWKVIHDLQTNSGVAIIQINNPWLEKVTNEHIVCDNICDKLNWITWNTTDIIQGYTYCCSVESFRQKVTYAPNLGNLPLFNPTAGPSDDGNDGAFINSLEISIPMLLLTLHFQIKYLFDKL